jgi:hypothetical protein
MVDSAGQPLGTARDGRAIGETGIGQRAGA